MKSFLTVAVFLVLWMPGLEAAEFPWQMKKNEKGIQVFVREVEGSALLEFRGTTVVDRHVDEVVAFYEDASRMPDWFHHCLESKLLEEKTPDEKILYFAIAMPWPVKDRDSVYRRVRTRTADGGVEFHAHAVPDFYPLRQDRIRMPEVKGVWRFKPLEDGRTEVYYQQHGSAGGFIPAWLVNKLAVNIPYQTLYSLREILNGPGLERKKKT